MSFVRYKRFGKKEYAYEVTAYWDPVKKRPRQKVVYLGEVVNKKRKIFQKKLAKRVPEKLILDFGDVYLLHNFMEREKLVQLLTDVFGKETENLLALLCYRLCHPAAMCYARIWYEGSVARLLFKKAELASQRISEFLHSIGNESLQRDFFMGYISSFVASKEGVIIDTTALPNQIHLPFTAWGYNDSDINKQIRFLFVIERGSGMPIFFRYLPGNVVDVSSLQVTLAELQKFGIQSSFVLIGAGFYSRDNILNLYHTKIDFLLRLPARTALHKELIRREVVDIEKLKHAVRFGKRALFIKQIKINLLGKPAWAHIILDPERKGRELRKFLLEVMEGLEKGSEGEIELAMKKRGGDGSPLFLQNPKARDHPSLLPKAECRETLWFLQR